MTTIRTFEITSEYDKDLLKQIEIEIPRINLRNKDGHGNREYEPSKMLNEKIRTLMASLNLSVRILHITL